MSAAKSVRVKKRKAVQVAATEKRRGIKARQSPKAESDVLLVSQFAEALGQAYARKRRPKARRSLMAALQQTEVSFSLVDVMPGARIDVLAAVSGDRDNQISLPIAPCVAVHRRRRLKARLIHAGSWSVAAMVSAAIISAAAFGILANAPLNGVSAIKTASAAQF